MSTLETYLAQQNGINKNGSLRLRDVAYERIKDAILNAGAPPETLLSENSLSKALGISRTPVREAIQRLAQEGFLDIVPGRSVSIASQTYENVLDVVHIRQLLEPELVRLVCEHMGSAEIAKLEQAMRGMEAAIEQQDRTEWGYHDAIYHELLSNGCPNKILGTTVLRLRNSVHHMANIDTQSDPNRLAACTKEHREIVDAIMIRDSQVAEAATRQHLLNLRNSLLNRFQY